MSIGDIKNLVIYGLVCTRILIPKSGNSVNDIFPGFTRKNKASIAVRNLAGEMLPSSCLESL